MNFRHLQYVRSSPFASRWDMPLPMKENGFDWPLLVMVTKEIILLTLMYLMSKSSHRGLAIISMKWMLDPGQTATTRPDFLSLSTPLISLLFLGHKVEAHTPALTRSCPDKVFVDFLNIVIERVLDGLLHIQRANLVCLDFCDRLHDVFGTFGTAVSHETPRIRREQTYLDSIHGMREPLAIGQLGPNRAIYRQYIPQDVWFIATYWSNWASLQWPFRGRLLDL